MVSLADPIVSSLWLERYFRAADLASLDRRELVTVFIVCAFGRGPVAVFTSMEKAHAAVLRRPGKYNNYEVEELELDEDAGDA